MTQTATPAASPGMRRRRGMTEEAAETAVDQACRALRLPTIRTRVEEMVAVAEKEQLTYRGFLAELLLAECDDRTRRRTVRRVKAAGFPREKWLGDFDFDANPNVNPATIHALATAAWVRTGQPLCLIGDCYACRQRPPGAAAPLTNLSGYGEDRQQARLNSGAETLLRPESCPIGRPMTPSKSARSSEGHSGFRAK